MEMRGRRNPCRLRGQAATAAAAEKIDVAGTNRMMVGKVALRSDQSALSVESSVRHRLAALLQRHRRPLCFLTVGSVGLATDIVLFTMLAMQGLHPLAAGFVGQVVATVVT